TGMTTNQDGGAGHQATAEYTIKLVDAGGDTRRIRQLDFIKAFDHRHFAGKAAALGAARRRRRAISDKLTQRIPLAARRTLALPLGKIRTALGAHVRDLAFSHQQSPGAVVP